MTPSAECCTDHRLVRCNLRLQFKAKLGKKGNDVKKLNVGSLCREDVEAKFQAELHRKLIIPPCNDDPTQDTLWDNLKSTTLKTSADVLGYTKKKNRNWVDGNDRDSGLGNREDGIPSRSPCTTYLSCKESFFLMILQHSTVQAERNTEQVVEQTGVEDPAM